MEFAIFQSASRRRRSFLRARHTGNEGNYYMATDNAINRYTHNYSMTVQNWVMQITDRSGVPFWSE